MTWEDYATNDTAHGGSCLTPDDECEECGHPIRAHMDTYGCEIEGGDVWVEGTNCGGLVAAGPCGCQAHKAEYEQQQILAASRSVRAGADMLFAALRKNGVL